MRRSGRSSLRSKYAVAGVAPRRKRWHPQGESARSDVSTHPGGVPETPPRGLFRPRVRGAHARGMDHPIPRDRRRGPGPEMRGIRRVQRRRSTDPPPAGGTARRSPPPRRRTTVVDAVRGAGRGLRRHRDRRHRAGPRGRPHQSRHRRADERGGPPADRAGADLPDREHHQPMTATVVLQLVEEGRVGWTTPRGHGSPSCDRSTARSPSSSCSATGAASPRPSRRTSRRSGSTTPPTWSGGPPPAPGLPRPGPGALLEHRVRRPRPADRAGPGLPLADVLDERIFEPAAMESSSLVGRPDVQGYTPTASPSRTTTSSSARPPGASSPPPRT